MFRKIFSGRNRNVLGINRRNLEYIYPDNSQRFMHLADCKLTTKKILAKAGLPFSETYTVFSNFTDVMKFDQTISEFDNFVVKPNKGRGGSGVMILGDKLEGGFESISGSLIKYERIRKRVCDILFGVFSLGMSDRAIVEKRIFAHPFLSTIYNRGLPDIRIISYHKEPVAAMLRYPTDLSDGKANLHQGGIGIGIDLKSGETTSAIFKGNYINKHPDSGQNILGLKVPFYQEMLDICRNFPDDIPLNYLGFDFTIDEDKGPVIIEVNARPGLEIQNANKTGLLKILKRDK